MDAEITALAAIAAQELVRSMAGSGWTLLRNGIAELLGLGDGERAGRLAEDLDASRDLVQREPGRGAAVGGRWEGRLESLLEEHPELAAKLQELVESAQRRHAEESGSTIGGNLTITASHGSIAGYRMGDVTLNTGSGS